MGLLEEIDMKTYYLLKDSGGNYLYNFEIIKSPYSNTGDIWTKLVGCKDFAIWFTKKYLAEAIAKALKMDVEAIEHIDAESDGCKKIRYIRTNDGKLIDISDWDERKSVDSNGNRTFAGYSDDDGHFYEVNDIIKQSNNIEELCDCYFAISNTGFKTPIKIDFKNKVVYQWQSDSVVVKYAFKDFMPYHTIYGAIWTDKGIVYVAKMNEKETFRLL